MSSPVQIPASVLSSVALDDMIAGDYSVHSLSTQTSINGSKAGRRLLTYAGGVLAITLSAPVAGADDGKLIEIMNLAAEAHTVTCTGKLIDGNGHSNTLTFAAHAGSCAII